jgi:hypothetical protein
MEEHSAVWKVLLALVPEDYVMEECEAYLMALRNVANSLRDGGLPEPEVVDDALCKLSSVHPEGAVMLLLAVSDGMKTHRAVHDDAWFTYQYQRTLQGMDGVMLTSLAVAQADMQSRRDAEAQELQMRKEHAERVAKGREDKARWKKQIEDGLAGEEMQHG